MNRPLTILHGARGVCFALLVIAVAHASVGCGGDQSSPTAPNPQPLRTASSFGAGPVVGGLLSAPVVEAMNDGIQDEYHAEFTYMKVLEQFGDVQPFYRIVHAEERHSEAIARLFVNYGLAVPESRWHLGNVPVFVSLAEACAGGAAAELENIALYDDFLTLELPQDVRNVFTNLRAASLENHLPAFQACCACNQ